MSEQELKPEVDQAAESWTWLVEAAAALLLLVGTAVALHYYAPSTSAPDLQSEVRELNDQLQQMKREQAMPVMVLNRYRNSICYVFGVYQVGFPNQAPRLRARVSGTPCDQPPRRRTMVRRFRGRCPHSPGCDSHAGKTSRVFPGSAGAI